MKYRITAVIEADSPPALGSHGNSYPNVLCTHAVVGNAEGKILDFTVEDIPEPRWAIQVGLYEEPVCNWLRRVDKIETYGAIFGSYIGESTRPRTRDASFDTEEEAAEAIGLIYTLAAIKGVTPEMVTKKYTLRIVSYTP